MNANHGLKAGDKIKSPMGNPFDVVEVEGRFAVIRRCDGRAIPIMFHNGAWRSYEGGHAWTVVTPRWRAERWAEHYVIYDSGRLRGEYAATLWGDYTDLTADQIAEAAEAIVELLNERFPA